MVQTSNNGYLELVEIVQTSSNDLVLNQQQIMIAIMTKTWEITMGHFGYELTLRCAFGPKNIFCIVRKSLS